MHAQPCQRRDSLRQALTTPGLDSGADTIVWHLRHHHQVTLSRATTHRILARHGAVTPASTSASMRPTTAPGTGADSEVITQLDDHSPHVLHLNAHPQSAEEMQDRRHRVGRVRRRISVDLP